MSALSCEEKECRFVLYISYSVVCAPRYGFFSYIYICIFPEP